MRSRNFSYVPKTPRQTLILIGAGLLLLLLGVQLVRVARLYSLNWDEAHHLLDGYTILTRGDYRANAEVPPLVKIAAALPILPLHPMLPATISDSQTLNAFLNGRVFVFRNGGDRLVFPARMACMAITLLTGVFLFAAGRSMFGALAGLCALLLFAFDPNLMAHGTLISTDMGSACFLFAGVYAFYRYAVMQKWRWLLAAGVLAGLAMAAKFTGILIVPMLVLLALAEGLRMRKAAVAGRLLAAAVAVSVCGWLVLWAFYGFRYGPAPAGLALRPSLAEYIASLPHPADGAKLALLARFHVFPEAYLWGLADTKHKEWEFVSYFLGRIYRHGPAWYFPLAFVIKSTLPLLILLVLTPFVWMRGGRKYGRELVFLLLPVGVYGAVVVTSHFDIGARHLMPVYPFLYAIAGATAAIMLRRGPWWAAVTAGLLLWQVVTTVRVAPNYMAYGNEAFGGPLEVRRYLSDANVDWGQQLKTVKQYLDENHVRDCWFAYFPDGAVEPRDYGVPCKRLPTPSGLWWFNLPMTVPPVIEGTVLLSESDLDGVESGDGTLNPYDAFHGVKPVAILQDGVYVYRGRFAVPLAAAWVDVRQSGQMAAAGHIAEALQAAQEAVALAPESPRTQLQLADMLAKQKQWASAAEHYRLAQEDLARQRPDLQAEELAKPIAQGLQAALAAER